MGKLIVQGTLKTPGDPKAKGRKALFTVIMPKVITIICLLEHPKISRISRCYLTKVMYLPIA